MAEVIFDAPIPGSSLVREVGNSPLKNPPQYVTVEEAINFYVNRMSSDEFVDKFLISLEYGVPITSIANIIQLHGVMEGRHTLDVSMLIMPVIIELLALIAESNNVEYDMGLENKNAMEDTQNELIEVAKNKLIQKSNNKIIDEQEMEDQVLENTEIENMVEEDTPDISRGLMAREV